MQCLSMTPVEWKFNDGDIPSNAQLSGSRNSTLSLIQVTTVNSGYYQCKGRDIDNEEYFYARAQLTVIGSFMY